MQQMRSYNLKHANNDTLVGIKNWSWVWINIDATPGVAVVTSVARSSAATILTMQGVRVPIFQDEGGKLTAAFQCWWIVSNANM